MQSYLYLDEQLDDLCPSLRGQVVEVGKYSAHDETSYLEAKKNPRQALFYKDGLFLMMQ